MKSFHYKNKKIAFQSIGKGFPIVLIHGFCEDQSMWIDFIEGMDNDFQFVTIDLPGFGHSDVIEDVSIAEMAEVVKLVLDKLNIAKCLLYGHSMGGYVSLAFAKKYEDRLIGLGMFHSHPFEDTAEKKAGRQKSIDFIDRNGSILYIKQLIPKLFAPHFISSNSFLVDKMTFAATQYAPAGIKASLKAMMKRPDNSETLKKLNIPVSFIVGKLDGAIPIDASLRQIYIPAISDIHILQKVGHMGMFEAKKESLKIVRQFIDFCLYYNT